MPYLNLKCYLLLKLASHLVRTRTTMEISSNNNNNIQYLYSAL